MQVFVPEDEEPSPRLVSNTSTAGAASPASVSGRTASADPWETAEATGADSESTPAWWTPQPSIYVEPAYRREVKFQVPNTYLQAVAGRFLGLRMRLCSRERSNVSRQC